MSESSYKKVPALENEIEQLSTPQKYGYGIRHVQGFIFFLTLSVCYTAKGHMGVSIVAMTNNASTGHNNNLNVTNDNVTVNSLNARLIYEENNTSFEDVSWSIYRTYNWSKPTQEMVLNSFFLGTCITMFPSGIICQKWGGKLPLQIALIVNGIVSTLSPWLVAWGNWKALCACRFLQGLTQAGVYPSIQTLLSNWVPISERGSFSGYIYTGSGFGTVLAFQIGGILAYSQFGWPSTFWLVGAACLTLFLLITFCGAANPTAHKSISIEETNYIVGYTKNRVQTKSITPWKTILTSVPAWSIFIAQIGSTVCYVFFYIQVPTYLNAIMKLNIRNNGILSSLPYFATMLASMVFGYMSDFCTNRKILSIKNARKLSNTIASVIPAICVISVSYTSNVIVAVVLLVISQSSFAAVHTGWMINCIDLAPNYTGAMYAIGSTLGMGLVLILPVLVSHIVTDVTNQYQWRIMIFLIAAVTVLVNVVFVIFMSSEVQPWNNKDDKKQEPEEEKLQSVNGTNKDS